MILARRIPGYWGFAVLALALALLFWFTLGGPEWIADTEQRVSDYCSGTGNCRSCGGDGWIE